MPDIVLINPGESQAIYQGLAHGLTAIEPPLWCRMIGGWLRDHGYGVAIIDQNAEALSCEEVVKRVEGYEPLHVAIVVEGHQPSASTQAMVGAVELAKALKPWPVTMVGHHPSALPVQTLMEAGVTYVCDGEGPLTLAALVDGVALGSVPGLVWSKGGDACHNPRAPLIPINDMAGDVWDLLPMGRYRAHNWQCLDGSPRQPYASVYTSLGCPYKCSFCMINVFQHVNRYRMRSPESVVAEIKMLYEDHGVRTFKIADEMFVLNAQHVREICEGLEPFAEHLNIWAYARVDTVKPGQPEMLRRAGIRWLALGIESGSEHVRDGADKSFGEREICGAVSAIRAAGINVIGNFIFGLPDDTMETMQATLDMAKALNCEFANFYSAMAYPGSRLYDEASPDDLPANWSGYSQHSGDCTPLPTATLTSADVVRFRDRAFREYFEGDDYRAMIAGKFGISAVDQIGAMLSKPMERAA